MLKKSVTVEDVVHLLNQLTYADRDAMKNLVSRRVPCRVDLASHPYVQAHQTSDVPTYEVGMLGVLNAFFGVDENGVGALKAIFDVVCPNREHHEMMIASFALSKEHQDGEVLRRAENARYGEHCPICKASGVLPSLSTLELGDLKGFSS